MFRPGQAAKYGLDYATTSAANPRIVYAAMWQFRRWPDFFESGGPGSGLYKSSDGGETWKQVTRGLPEGELGRIAVAVAPSRPSVVYATVEAEETALYRSDDLGETWSRKDSSMNTTSVDFPQQTQSPS